MDPEMPTHIQSSSQTYRGNHEEAVFEDIAAEGFSDLEKDRWTQFKSVRQVLS